MVFVYDASHVCRIKFRYRNKELDLLNRNGKNNNKTELFTIKYVHNARNGTFNAVISVLGTRNSTDSDQSGNFRKIKLPKLMVFRFAFRFIKIARTH